MSIINDKNCGWINNLPERTNIKKLNSNLYADYLIVGAGYTGLSAARQLANNFKSSKIILIERIFMNSSIAGSCTSDYQLLLRALNSATPG